jgi:hypothetical protein
MLDYIKQNVQPLALAWCIIASLLLLTADVGGVVKLLAIGGIGLGAAGFMGNPDKAPGASR